MLIFLVFFGLICAILNAVNGAIATKISGDYFDIQFAKQGKEPPLVFYVMGTAKGARTSVYLSQLLMGGLPFFKFYSKKNKEK